MTSAYNSGPPPSSGCLLTDVEGRITSVSPDALAMIGQRVSDVIGRFITDFVAPDQLSELAEAYRAALEGQDSVRCPIALPAQATGAGGVDARLFMVNDSAGRPRAISVVFAEPSPPVCEPPATRSGRVGETSADPQAEPTDTEPDSPRSDAKADAMESEALVRALMETMALGLAVTDPDGTIVKINPMSAEIMGGPDAVGTSIDDSRWVVSAPDGTNLEPSRFPAAIALREGRSVHGEEIRIQRPDGEWRWLSVSSEPVDHDAYGVIIAFTDVTRSKESEARLKATFAAVSDLIFTLDRDGRYGVLEGGVDSPFIRGRPASEFAGRLRSERTGDDPMHGEAQDRAFSGEHVVYEWRFEGIEPARWVQTSLSPMTDAFGEVHHVVGVTRDITDRVSLEEARLEMQRRSVEAQKAESLSVLAGGVAHDFNNLLSGVLLNAELARKDVGPTEYIRELLDDIVTAAERATDLSRQMLAYSGRGAIHRTRVRPNEILRALRSALAPGFGPGLTIELDLAEALPEVEGDQSQIWQALYHVTSNAVEAMEGEGRVSISTALIDFDPATSSLRGPHDQVSVGRYLDIQVVDNGPGIDPDIEDRIFEPFFGDGGRGLGLSAAHGIALAHGGAILHEPAPGGGTRFHLLLPPAPTATPGERTEDERIAPLPPKRPTVLFADDESIVRRAGARLLDALGFDVIKADDGEMALELWESHRDLIDLVILDVTMPRLGGRETLARLREREPGLKVLLTSGYDAADVLGTPGPTPDGFIEKPFRLDRVRAGVDAVMA